VVGCCCRRRSVKLDVIFHAASATIFRRGARLCWIDNILSDKTINYIHNFISFVKDKFD
jgi:hypothetical protein